MADMDFDKGTTKTGSTPFGDVTVTSQGFVVAAKDIATVDDLLAVVAAIRGSGVTGPLQFALSIDDVATQDEARAAKAAVRGIGHQAVQYFTAEPIVTPGVSDENLVGLTGRVTVPVSADLPGEVMLDVRGGCEAYTAYGIGGEELRKNSQAVVMEQCGPRSVMVTSVSGV